MGINMNTDLIGTESLSSLQQQASQHRDWRDSLNWIFGNDLSSDFSRENWANREIGPDGRVKVTAFDAAIGRSQPELQAAYELYRRQQLQIDPNFRALRGEGLIDPGKIDENTSISSLSQSVNNYNTNSQLESDIRAIPNGSALLADITGSKTSSERTSALQGALTQAQLANEKRLREVPGGANDQYELLKNQDTRAGNQDTRAGELQSAQIQQGKDTLQLTRQAQSDNRHNAEEQRRYQRWRDEGDRADRRAAQKDKMDLALLQMREKRLDRDYNRERDRRDDARATRDKKLALIMSALGNINRGFSRY